MTKREKALIAITVVATGASVFMFAFVSLANFLKSTPHTPPPIVAKMYEQTLDQIATLEQVPVTDTATSPPTEPNQSPSTQKNPATVSHSNRHSLKPSPQGNRSQINSNVQVSAAELAELSKILKEAGFDPKDPKLLSQLKDFSL